MYILNWRFDAHNSIHALHSNLNLKIINKKEPKWAQFKQRYFISYKKANFYHLNQPSESLDKDKNPHKAQILLLHDGNLSLKKVWDIIPREKNNLKLDSSKIIKRNVCAVSSIIDLSN